MELKTQALCNSGWAAHVLPRHWSGVEGIEPGPHVPAGPLYAAELRDADGRQQGVLLSRDLLRPVFARLAHRSQHVQGRTGWRHSRHVCGARQRSLRAAPHALEDGSGHALAHHQGPQRRGTPLQNTVPIGARVPRELSAAHRAPLLSEPPRHGALERPPLPLNLTVGIVQRAHI
jgi:hypothetical protein